jgi:periplasmic divalent cation tolerance protein
MNSAYRLIFCTCPDINIAEHLAHALVSKKLAACVNIIPGLKSFYHWQEKIETSQECLLMIKSTEQNYVSIETFIKENHPYDCPEVIEIPIIQGLKGYLQWIDKSLLSVN